MVWEQRLPAFNFIVFAHIARELHEGLVLVINTIILAFGSEVIVLY